MAYKQNELILVRSRQSACWIERLFVRFDVSTTCYDGVWCRTNTSSHPFYWPYHSPIESIPIGHIKRREYKKGQEVLYYDKKGQWRKALYYMLSNKEHYVFTNKTYVGIFKERYVIPYKENEKLLSKEDRLEKQMSTIDQYDLEFQQEILPVGVLSKAISFIRNKLSPSDVFQEYVLHAWAVANGYVREDLKDLREGYPVLVKFKKEDKWIADVFLRYEIGAEFPFHCRMYDYAECIPYQGNEHLLGTV